MEYYGKVQSTVRPKPIEVDRYHVYVNSNIIELNTDEFSGYEYEMVQYDKDEYIMLLQSDIDYIGMMTGVL